MLIVNAIIHRQPKHLETIVNRICDDLYHKEIAFKCKCKRCKKRYVAYELEPISMCITIVDSQCPYCNAINISEVYCDGFD